MNTPDPATAEDRRAAIRARLDAAEQVITGKRRQDDAVQVLWFHAVADIEFLLSELEAAQARLDAATDLHWPTTIDGRLDLVCGNSSDHGAWRHWPCPDAGALGLGKESTAPDAAMDEFEAADEIDRRWE